MNRIQEFTSKLSPTKNLAGRFKENEEKKEEKEINERDGFEFMIPSTPGNTLNLAGLWCYGALYSREVVLRYW